MKRMDSEEVKMLELDILEKFHKFTLAHDLKYVIDYGTLLGAIRHQGFIPWDDDIDVVMPRDDYDKFCALIDQEIMNETVNVRKDKRSKGDLPYIKIEDKRTIVFQKNRNNKYCTGVWIDVFPVDGYPGTTNKEKKITNKISYINHLRLIIVNKSKSKNIIRLALKNVYGLLNKPYIFVQIMTYIAKKEKYVNYKKGINYFSPYKHKDIFEVNYFEDRVLVSFENLSVYAANNWEHRLKTLYGDYMVLPPLEKRRTHNIEAYWK